MARFLPPLTIIAILFSTTMCQTKVKEPEKYIPPPDRKDIGVVCSQTDHFTDPKFTCCASIRYEAPAIYTNMASSCWTKGGSTDKIVKTAWEVFKCLVDGALSGKGLTFDNLADILSANLPSGVKSGIKAHLKNMTTWYGTGYAPYTGKQPELKGYENYANKWNAYYLAENWACSDAGSKGRQRLNTDEDHHRCYNHIDQATRRGDCCKQVPIPFQLIPDPIVDRYYALKNWTATHLMSLAGKDFDWKNTTVVMYSDNIATCLRTAMFIQQGITSEAEVKKQIDARIPPNYAQFAEALVPKWMGKGVRTQIIEEVANETAINNDTDIQALNNTWTTLYRFVYADEWKSGRYIENATRFLFWTCRAHNLMMRRFKDVPMSEYCY